MITAIIFFVMLIVLVAVMSYINNKDEKQIRKWLVESIRSYNERNR